jgi:vacuolar-type H+-ATPase catalytic subunit A/Vma1
LRDVAALVGVDALEPGDRLVMEIAAIARELLLRQNVFHPHDASSSPRKTHGLARAICTLEQASLRVIGEGLPMEPGALDAAKRALHALREADEASLEGCITTAMDLAARIAPAGVPETRADSRRNVA